MSNDLHGSHISFLIKLMDLVDRPVIELGVGYGSTPLLHWLCKEKGLRLISMESDREWMKLFEDYQSQDHKLAQCDFENNGLEMMMELALHVEDESKLQRAGLVFIDHRPARKRRSSAKLFHDKADIVVLHDSELADNPAYKYTPIYDLFKYKLEYTAVGKPYTIALSNYINLSEELS